MRIALGNCNFQQVFNATQASSNLFENQTKQGNLLSFASLCLDPEIKNTQISLLASSATASASATSWRIMRSLTLLVFILLALLSISLSQSQGLGRNAGYLIRRAHRLQPNNRPFYHHQENMKIRREMREIETEDYDNPKANVNPRSGPLLNPPNPTPPPSN